MIRPVGETASRVLVRRWWYLRPQSIGDTIRRIFSIDIGIAVFNSCNVAVSIGHGFIYSIFFIRQTIHTQTLIMRQRKGKVMLALNIVVCPLRLRTIADHPLTCAVFFLVNNVVRLVSADVMLIVKANWLVRLPIVPSTVLEIITSFCVTAGGSSGSIGLVRITAEQIGIVPNIGLGVQIIFQHCASYNIYIFIRSTALNIQIQRVCTASVIPSTSVSAIRYL